MPKFKNSKKKFTNNGSTIYRTERLKKMNKKKRIKNLVTFGKRKTWKLKKKKIKPLIRETKWKKTFKTSTKNWRLKNKAFWKKKFFNNMSRQSKWRRQWLLDRENSRVMPKNVFRNGTVMEKMSPQFYWNFKNTKKNWLIKLGL